MMKVKSNKAPGPYGVRPRVLEDCAPQLSGVEHEAKSPEGPYAMEEIVP